MRFIFFVLFSFSFIIMVTNSITPCLINVDWAVDSLTLVSGTTDVQIDETLQCYFLLPPET
jgi:hypothetical protein